MNLRLVLTAALVLSACAPHRASVKCANTGTKYDQGAVGYVSADYSVENAAFYIYDNEAGDGKRILPTGFCQVRWLE